MNKINEYIQLQKEQLQLEIKSIKLIMKHAGAKGTEAEKILVNLLKKYLPKRYSFGSGFVTENDFLSPQTDIIIYDEILNSPIYQGEFNGVYKLGAVYACIEVTMGELTPEKLEEDIEKLGKIRFLAKGCKVKFKNISSIPHESGQGTIVSNQPFESSPPPRTYICALSGTSYKTPEELSTKIEELTKKYNAHMHGVLVIDDKSNESNKEWLVCTKAYNNHKTIMFTEDSLYQLIKQMNDDFLGMRVGKYPAAD